MLFGPGTVRRFRLGGVLAFGGGTPLALVLAMVLASSAVSQQRSETVAVTTTNPALVGFEADVYGSNFSTFALVGYVAHVSGFNFGNGTLASVGHSSRTDIQYTALGFKFSVIPQFVWGAWTQGLGTVIFEVKV